MDDNQDYLDKLGETLDSYPQAMKDSKTGELTEVYIEPGEGVMADDNYDIEVDWENLEISFGFEPDHMVTTTVRKVKQMQARDALFVEMCEMLKEYQWCGPKTQFDYQYSAKCFCCRGTLDLQTLEGGHTPDCRLNSLLNRVKEQT